MRKQLSVIFAVAGWFAVIAQYVLMVQASVHSFAETTTRFFTYFTILTNIIVAVYFTSQAIGKPSGFSFKPGVLTAVTVYITLVFLTYQVILRSLWTFAGLGWLVNELLHTVMPVATIVYWYLYENKPAVTYKMVLSWAIFPLLYFVFVLTRGSLSHFYPYPFMNVDNIGMNKVLTNSLLITLLFFFLAALFIWIGKAIARPAQVSRKGA